MRRYTPQSVKEQIFTGLKAFGLAEDQAQVCTEIMFATDLSGVDSHGISMLPLYWQEISDGTLNEKAEQRLVHQFGAVSVFDADHGFGHPVSVRAMDAAIEAAEKFGVGIGSVRNANHFGAAGQYVLRAARRGMVGIATCSTRSAMQKPTGAKHALMGTNPIAFAHPVKDEEPIFVDMATTVVPGNKVKVYAYADEPLAGEWATDGSGEVVTDGMQVYNALLNPESSDIGLLPVGGNSAGGHKGYALATMVQLLSAALSGSDQPGDVAGRQSIGYFFLAIDPRAFGEGADAEEYARVLRDTLRGMEPVDPNEPVQVAGDPEHRSVEDRSVNGIPISDGMVQAIREAVEDAGAEFTLTEV